MKILKKLLKFFKQNKYPDCLRIKGRKKLPTSEFLDNENLYHSYATDDLDDLERIKLETIRFPDFSCNWSRFSNPEHVRYRENGKMTDGCYSFTVEISRYKKIATPVHDPIDDKKYPNYAHVEIRELLPNEDILFEPPKNRYSRAKTRKSLRLEYRQNLLNNIRIELESA